ncbi:hypothetical protein ACOME3_009968 [Neoechinorhynchus agilis]
MDPKKKSDLCFWKEAKCNSIKQSQSALYSEYKHAECSKHLKMKKQLRDVPSLNPNVHDCSTRSLLKVTDDKSSVSDYKKEAISILCQRDQFTKYKQKSLQTYNEFETTKPNAAYDVSNAGNERISIIGMSIEDLCSANDIKRPLIDLLALLYFKGSETPDIFRRAPNYRKATALAQKLSIHDYTRERGISALNYNNSRGSNQILKNLLEEPHMVASILKRFLMRLDRPFFDESICDMWSSFVHIDTAKEENNFEKIKLALQLLQSMGSSKTLFWNYFLIALNKIHQNKTYNRMDSKNLGICISGTLFKNDSCTLNSAHNMSKIAADFVSFNIEFCHKLVPGSRKIIRVLELHLFKLIEASGTSEVIDFQNVQSKCPNIEDEKILTRKSPSLSSTINRHLDTVRDRMRTTAKRIDFKAKTFRRSSLLERLRSNGMKDSPTHESHRVHYPRIDEHTEGFMSFSLRKALQHTVNLEDGFCGTETSLISSNRCTGRIIYHCCHSPISMPNQCDQRPKTTHERKRSESVGNFSTIDKKRS